MDRRAFLAAAAAAPLALRSGTQRTVALVTADTEAAVVSLDVSSGAVLRRIETRPDPRSIERVGEHAVVAHTAVGELSILRGVDVRHVLRGFGEPRYAAAAPEGRHAYVSDSGRKDVAVVDVLRGRVLSRLRLVGWPRHLSLDSSGRVLWVALGTEARELAVVDVTRPVVPRHLGTVRPSFRLHDVGFVPGRGQVWITSGDRGTIAIHDARTGHAVKRLPAGSPPQHVTLHGGNACVTSGGDGTLHVHRLRGGHLLRELVIPR